MGCQNLKIDMIDFELPIAILKLVKKKWQVADREPIASGGFKLMVPDPAFLNHYNTPSQRFIT